MFINGLPVSFFPVCFHQAVQYSWWSMALKCAAGRAHLHALRSSMGYVFVGLPARLGRLGEGH